MMQTNMTQQDAAQIYRHLTELAEDEDMTTDSHGTLLRVAEHLRQQIKILDGVTQVPTLENNELRVGETMADYFAVNADLTIHHNEKGTVSLASAQAVMNTPFPIKGSASIDIVVWWARALARLRYVHAAAMLETRLDKSEV